MREKVSIVVPIYNREKFLDKCITSILAQSYTNIEILLVDDGSSDKSLEICKKYEKNDNRIRVIHKENGGVQSARNKGIDEAGGKYLCFVDADDYVSKDFIRNFISVYDSEDVECVVCGHCKVDKDGNILVENKDMLNIDIPKFECERWALYFERFACYCWNHMFLLDKVRSNNVRFDKNIVVFDDTAFTMNYLKHIDRIGFTKSNDYYYVSEHDEYTVVKSLNAKRVNDGGCWEKAKVCILKYNKYVRNKQIEGSSNGNLKWVSSSLFHIGMISYLIYISTVLYDYRYDKKMKKKIFNESYEYIKMTGMHQWFYDCESLNTMLPSVRLIKPMMKIFVYKYIFYVFCLLCGSKIFSDMRIKLHNGRKK